jgi:nucleoid-associated protein YgaU
MYAAGSGIKPWRAGRAGGVRFGWRALAAAVGVALFGVGMAAAAHGSPPTGYSTVVVQPGDTLWSIATQRYPGDDVRERVQDIEAANGLQGPQIRPGESLRLPG